jgi:hypothetical protein
MEEKFEVLTAISIKITVFWTASVVEWSEFLATDPEARV